MGPVLLQEETGVLGKKLAMVSRDKLDNTLLTSNQGNFNQITAQSQNRTLVTVVRNTCTTAVPPAPYFL